MRRIGYGLLTLLTFAAVPARAEVPVTLRGSPESMLRQNGVAREADYAFVRTPAQMGRSGRVGVLRSWPA